MIALIRTTLTKVGCYVVLSSGDADVEIVKSTVYLSRRSTKTLVDVDTDLHILILRYFERDNKTIYIRSDVN
ncbi:hypothetical protein DPMN_177300 [Dreissena polymorpha]|uniref:Uncharacterized protein n=1 Tax=Dreissena polymorpha TaxID=45954 RepID=A0A9D4ECS5_DREPO|nr:hypothetical protein DPMN_177300 [Dreissena polymorpha]